MLVVVNAALPLFAIIAAGFLAGRIGLFDGKGSQIINKFVYWVALPPVLFIGVAEEPLERSLNLNFIGAYLGGVIGAYFIAALISRLRGHEGLARPVMEGMAACFANTGYMGIPLFLVAFGAQNLAPAIVATAVQTIVMFLLTVTAMEVTMNRDLGVGQIMAKVSRAIVTNPLIMAPAAGYAFAITGLSIADAIRNFAEVLGGASGPCALFSIGLFLALHPLSGGDMRSVAIVSVLKLFVHPLITIALIATIFPLSPDLAAAAIILAALPTGGLVFVMAERSGVYVVETTAAIMVTTLVSVVTLSIVLGIYSGAF